MRFLILKGHILIIYIFLISPDYYKILSFSDLVIIDGPRRFQRSFLGNIYRWRVI